MKTQKELKEKYMDIITRKIWPGNSEMQAYAKKTCAYVVELSSGCIIDIEKPSIKKNFCFGAGAYARATEQELDEAENMVSIAETSQDYFKARNLEKLNSHIEELKEAAAGKREVYSYLHYSGQEKGSKLRTYTVCKISGNPEYYPGYWSNCQDLEKMSGDDIVRIIAGLEEVRKAFVKRIDTYLKRYGTSNVHAWSYIRD